MQKPKNPCDRGSDKFIQCIADWIIFVPAILAVCLLWVLMWVFCMVIGISLF